MDTYTRRFVSVSRAIWSSAKVALVAGSIWIVAYLWQAVHVLPSIDLATAGGVAICVASVGAAVALFFAVMFAYPGIALRILYAYPKDRRDGEKRRKEWRKRSSEDAAVFFVGALCVVGVLLLTSQGSVRFPSASGITLALAILWFPLFGALRLDGIGLRLSVAGSFVAYGAFIDQALPDIAAVRGSAFLIALALALAGFGTVVFLFRRGRAARKRVVLGVASKALSCLALVVAMLPLDVVSKAVANGGFNGSFEGKQFAMAIILVMMLGMNLGASIGRIAEMVAMSAGNVIFVIMLTFSTCVAIPMQILGLGQVWYRADIIVPTRGADAMVRKCLNLPTVPAGRNGAFEHPDSTIWVVSAIGSRWQVEKNDPRGTYPTGFGAKEAAPRPAVKSGIAVSSPCAISVPVEWIQAVQRVS
jgi:hypothetical protein